jgi:phospholipase D3/4
MCDGHLSIPTHHSGVLASNQTHEEYGIKDKQQSNDDNHDHAHNHGTAFLLETIPRDTTLLPIPGTRDTWEVQMDYIQHAQRTIDFWAMYWTLLDDNAGYTSHERQRWGTDRGKQLYQALGDAAARGVHIRVLSEHRLHGLQELVTLQQRHPDYITFRLWNASQWYDYGMMHIKAWTFDNNRAMITDANTDWRSFTQVKEVGVAFESAAPGFQAVLDLQRLFDRWWAWTDPVYTQSLHDELRVEVFDPNLQTTRLVPCFSMFGDRTLANNDNDDNHACKSPFDADTTTVYNLANPMPLRLNNTLGHTFLSCSPPEVCDTPDAAYSQTKQTPLVGRTWDGEALVQTILSAREQICLSTMYFIPAALTTFLENPAWWPALVDALLLKVSQGLSVRLLISQWRDAYTAMPGYFHALLSSAEANAQWARHNGTIEVRYFALPGWQNATGHGDAYPQYSRVNHGKYIVTDNRFNLGTNEMEWSFFFQTAGTSFNSDHPLLRDQLQAIFDRDWNSEYAIPLPS